MRTQIKISKNSILTRIIVTFFIVVTPIFILGLSISTWGIKTVDKQIIDSMNSQLDYYLKTFDAEIRRIKGLQYSCLYDENLLKLAYVPESLNDFEKVQTIKSIQERLDAMKSSSLYITDVSVHVKPANLTISTKNSVLPLQEEGFDIFESQTNESESQLIYWENNIFSSMKNRTASLNDKSPAKFIIQIELSNSELKDTLLNFNNKEDSGALLINLSNNYMVASYSDEAINKKVLDIIKGEKNLNEETLSSVKIGHKYYTIVYKKSNYLNMMLVSFIPEVYVYAQIYRYRALVWTLIILSIVIIFIYSFSMYKIIHKPLVRLVEAFKKVEGGDLKVSIQHQNNDEFQYLYNSFNVMVQNLNNLIEQVYKQKIINQKAELKQLQSQINPHFLFNSFFILKRMVQSGDVDRAVIFCEHLGTYFQFITRSGRDEIALSNELAHAKSYAEIQSIRFLNRIYFEFGKLPEELNAVKVPRLILQPLIENAFEHGLKDKVKEGIITLKFLENKTKIHIIIEDNGENLSDDTIKEIQNKLNTDYIGEYTGIYNIHKRINLMFGGNSGITVSRASTGGLKVDVFIRRNEDV